jgi:hypothetical protein
LYQAQAVTAVIKAHRFRIYGNIARKLYIRRQIAFMQINSNKTAP